MKKSLKAALLSGLIFPGIGQFWLKHRARGFAFIIAITLLLVVMVTKATQLALHILEKAESEGGAIDLVAIVHSATVASLTSADHLAMKWASILLVGAWIMAIIDAYLLGRKMDMVDQSKHEARKQQGGPR